MKKRQEEKKFDTKDFKGILVIGIKHGGDKNTIVPYIAGNSQELIMGIATVMEQMPVFKQMCTEALMITQLNKPN